MAFLMLGRAAVPPRACPERTMAEYDQGKDQKEQKGQKTRFGVQTNECGLVVRKNGRKSEGGVLL